MNELALPDEDYTLKEFFPKTIPYHLQPLIEHRIQLILKENTTFHGGDIKVVNTCCMLNGELKRTKLSIFLIPTENLGLVFESGGYISNSYKGRVVVKLANHSGKTFKLQSGTPVGYLVLQPYSLEWNLNCVSWYYLSFMKCVSLYYFYYLLHLFTIVFLTICKINDRKNLTYVMLSQKEYRNTCWRLCYHIQLP